MHPQTALFQVEFKRGGRTPRLRVVVDVAVAGLRLHIKFAGVGIALPGIRRKGSVGQRRARDERVHIGERAHVVPRDPEIRAAEIALPVVSHLEHEIAETLFNETRPRAIPVIRARAWAAEIGGTRHQGKIGECAGIAGERRGAGRTGRLSRVGPRDQRRRP